MRIDYLYEVRDGTGARIYIGRSFHPKQRAASHRRRWPGSILRVLVAGDHDYVCRLEVALIAKARSRGEHVRNVAPGGDNPPSVHGRRWSAATRQKLAAIMGSAAYKARMSASLRGKRKPQGHGARVSAAFRGVPKTEEHRRRLSESRANRTGWRHSASARQKIAESNRRRPVSAETRAKLSAANQRNRQLLSAMFKGRVFSEETRRRMSEAARNRKEVRNP